MSSIPKMRGINECYEWLKKTGPGNPDHKMVLPKSCEQRNHPIQ